MKTLITLLLFAPLLTWGADTLSLSSEISSVRVYLDAAQVFRTGTLRLPPGDRVVRIAQLSPFLDKNSIKVKGQGEVQFLSISHTVQNQQEKDRQAELRLLKHRLDSIQDYQKDWKAEQEVLKEKLSLLQINKTQNKDQMPDINQLNQIMEYYDAQLTQIKKRQLAISRSQAESMEVYNRIKMQRDALLREKGNPESEITLRVRVEKTTNFELDLSYVVDHAGWFPQYDIHATNVVDPIKITYKAKVFQQTGVDWKDVKLTFTNREAKKTGQRPVLQPWKINYERYTTRKRSVADELTNAHVQKVRGRVTDENGEPLPFVNIAVKNQYLGTTSDLDGYYELTLPRGNNRLEFSFIGYKKQVRAVSGEMLNIQLFPDAVQLEAVEIRSSAKAAGMLQTVSGVTYSKNSYSRSRVVQTTFTDRYTSAEFEIEGTYTLTANGRSEQVELKTYSIPSTYEYYVVPKLDIEVFLLARITDWGSYGFLPGEASIYFEETFIGKSVFDTRVALDTLSISLGTDPGVFASREMEKEYSKVRFAGNNRIDSRGVNLALRNNKKEPIRVKIIDQIPVSVNNAIDVTLLEYAEAEYIKEKGELRWDFKLEPGGNKKVMFGYQVKYPKEENILLE